MVDLFSNEGYKYTELIRDNLDVRVVINKEIAFIALRLMNKPLSDYREYKHFEYRGGLKNTIAYSMIYLLTQNIDLKSKKYSLVDNFCGSGTILLEAYHCGISTFGSDIDEKAAIMTKQRLKAVGCKNDNCNIYKQEATKTNWHSSQFDFVASNLPWDNQHQITKVSELYKNTLQEYKRILKNDYRMAFICHKPEIFIKYIKMIFGEVNINRIDLSLHGQNPSIVYVSNHEINHI